jgi:hypothetical protein
MRFADRYGMIILAIHRAGKHLETAYDENGNIRLKSRPLAATFVSQPLPFMSYAIFNNHINMLLTFLHLLSNKFKKISDIHVVASSRSSLNSNISFQNNFKLILVKIH